MSQHVAHRASDEIAALRELLREAWVFIAEEADNRSAAGSEMSDYEREPLDLAERIAAVLG